MVRVLPQLRNCLHSIFMASREFSALLRSTDRNLAAVRLYSCCSWCSVAIDIGVEVGS